MPEGFPVVEAAFFVWILMTTFVSLIATEEGVCDKRKKKTKMIVYMIPLRGMSDIRVVCIIWTRWISDLI